VCNEAAIKAGRRSDVAIGQADFDWALERVVAGLQQRKVLTEKERRILAYHEGGHALMAHLMGSVMELQKVTIVSRGNALGYAFYLPEEDRYLHTKEELADRMVVALAGRAAEEVVRLLRKHRAPLDRIASELLEKETLVRHQLRALVEDVEPESSASETVGVPRVVASDPGGSV